MNAITVLKSLLEQDPKTADDGLRLFFAAQTARHSLRSENEKQPENESLIFSAYALGAKVGDGNSACEAGKCCLLEFGTSLDYDQALDFFKRGRTLGHSESAYRIAHLLYWVKKDYDEAFLALELALESDPTGDAHYLKGQMHHRGHGCEADQAKAIENYEIAGDLDHADALFALYELTMSQPTDQEQGQRALDLCMRAAEAGSVHALYAMGTLYASGLGVSKNVQEAADWYLKASNAGHGKASATLGVIYLSGALDEPDETAAAFYFEKSVQQGFDFEDFLKQMGHSGTE